MNINNGNLLEVWSVYLPLEIKNICLSCCSSVSADKVISLRAPAAAPQYFISNRMVLVVTDTIFVGY